LQIGKQDVGISDVRPVGNYGICPTFSDGHNTGIYTWEFLYELGSRRQSLWDDYLERLKQAGQPRPIKRHQHAIDESVNRYQRDRP
jgi:DUF971 family protein